MKLEGGRLMNYFLKPSDKEINMLAISYIVFGLLICLFNVTILTMTIRVFGIIALLFSGYLLYTYFVQRISTSLSPLFIGFPGLLISILMVFSPESILAMLPILVGIILIINSIVHMQKSLILKDFGYPRWNISLIFSILVLITGVILLSQPIQSLSIIMQILGIALIVEAIFMLINQHILKRYD